MRVLSFTTVFPRPDDARLGLFVRQRLVEMSRLCSLRVVAPVALVEYGNQAGRFPGPVVSTRLEQGVAVRHPRWFYLPGLKALTPFFLALSAIPAVLEADFDVLDAHFGYPDGVAAALLAALFRRPFSVTLRGNETMHAQSASLRWLLAWTLRRAARVISVSERLRQFAISLGADPARAITIPNGIDPALFYPRDRAAARSKFGFSGSALHLMSVGYLIPRKGHDRAIAALAKLRAGGLNAHLWIVGNPGREGGCEAELRAQVAQLGLEEVVHFTGGVPHQTLAEYMTAADVLVLASAREGWPNVVHEALGCGTPVVAHDVGGVPDMLPDPRYGRVVPIGDQPQLEHALAEALQTQWDRPAIAAWGQARTWAAVAREAVAQLEFTTRRN